MVRRLATMAALALSGALMAACTHDDGRPAVAAAPGFGLFYNDQGATAALAYGRPHSDDVALMLQCEKGSGQVQVSDTVRAEPGASLVLTSAGRRAELPVKVETGHSNGPKILTATAPSGSPVLKGFRKSGRIGVAFGDVSYGVKARQDERAGVERFFSACDRA